MNIYLFKSPRDDECEDKFLTSLVSANQSPKLIPVLSFAFINLEILLREIKNPSAYGGIIFSSPRCVESFEKATADISEERRRYLKSSWNLKHIFCVGPATAEKAIKFFSIEGEKEELLQSPVIITSEAGNSDSLAKRILKESLSLPLLYPCGNLKKDTISLALSGANISVNTITVYNTQKNPELETIIAKTILSKEKGEEGKRSIYAFFSPSGINFTIDLLPSHKNNYIVALGPTTKDALLQIQSIDPGKVYQSQFPTPESLTETIVNILRTEESLEKT